VVAYAIIGAGYAWAHLDTPIGGEYNGRSVVLTDSNGFTANAGFTTETKLGIGWRF
jgi:hypothetical protein